MLLRGIHIGNDDNDLLVFITLGPMAFLCFLFCIPECMMDDGSTSAIFWKQEAPVAAAEGNFDFQEIASFLPVSLFFFSANRQKENLSKRKKKEKKRIFLSHHAITADSASTARRKVHFAARQCLTHEFLHEFLPILFCTPTSPIFLARCTTGVYIYLSKLSVYFRDLESISALCTLFPGQQNIDFFEISKFLFPRIIQDRSVTPPCGYHVAIHQYFSPTKFPPLFVDF